MYIVLLVIFIVVMLLWGFSNAGAIANPASSWIPFVAVLVLGLVVFLVGGGIVHVEALR